MEISADNAEAIPITILTGFLGAGKTTLMNRILKGDHGLRVAVLVNDFGSINIDADLIVGVKDDMISLSNGCVCCQVRDDLIEAVAKLLNREESVEYILLEASGVADPAGIFMTFNDSKFRNCIRLDSVTCILDADQAFAYQEYPVVNELKLRQIGFADMIILNKVDLADEEQVKKVKSWVNTQFNRIRIVETSYCDVDYEILLSVGRFDPARVIKGDGQKQEKPHEHAGNQFEKWSYETDKPFSLDALQTMIRKHLPETVYRCKGVVYTADAPDHRTVLQCVGRRTDVSLAGKWNNHKRLSKIVAIGAPGSIDKKALRESFDSCLSDLQV